MKSNSVKGIASSILCILLISFIWTWYGDFKIERELPYLLTDEMKVESVRLLYIQWDNNDYSVYPKGQYQKIKLSNEKQEKINELLYKLTKHTGQEIEVLSNSFKKRNLDWKNGWDKAYQNIPDDSIAPQVFDNFEYPEGQEFLNNMLKVDHIIGGNSTCSLDDIKYLVENESN